jgi:hypothetical protein
VLPAQLFEIDFVWLNVVPVVDGFCQQVAFAQVARSMAVGCGPGTAQDRIEQGAVEEAGGQRAGQGPEGFRQREKKLIMLAVKAWGWTGKDA